MQNLQQEPEIYQGFSEVQRLNRVREEAEKLLKEESRVQGEISSHQKRRSELEAKCKADVDTTPEDLDKVRTEIEHAAARSLKELELLLGIVAA